MHVSIETTHLQYFSCILGVAVSFLTYWAFMALWPPANGIPRPDSWAEPKFDFVDPTDPYLLEGRMEAEEGVQNIKVEVHSKDL